MLGRAGQRGGHPFTRVSVGGDRRVTRRSVVITYLEGVALFPVRTHPELLGYKRPDHA